MSVVAWYNGHMISVDPSDIIHWADRPDAYHKLPELVRRLILATVPMPSLLHMPSGSSVSRPGWDGLLVVESGNAWVPDGASGWEFSCEKNPKNKATKDYSKRAPDPAETFVFVTPRRWIDKDEWARTLREEGQWTDVRVLDTDDLFVWLQQAPAVANWFTNLIGKLPATGVVPLDEWWENWSTLATPQVSAELVTAGRQDQVGRVAQWLMGEPSHYFLKGDTREEAIAFLSACARAEVSQWGAALLAKAVVVRTSDAWRNFQSHSSPLVLVRDLSDSNVSPQIAVGRGHHVLTALDASDDPQGDGSKLPRLGRDETVTALKNMGLSEERARALARSTARRLPIIRRRLVDEAGGPTPEWASSSTPHSIVALVLIGQWNGDDERDKAIVAEVAGQPYEKVERDLTDLMTNADSPLTKVGNLWRLTSHEEAWHLLAPRLTSSDVQRFQRVAIDVFGAISPEFELPAEEQYMADVFGKVVPHSGTLREGMARSLALMGTHADRVKNSEGASYVPARVVSHALAAGTGWQTWATLSGSLTEFAEASPEALLDAVERDLDADPSPFEDLFDQEGDGYLGGTPHTGLLWALELLAWSPDQFGRVAKCLARLAEIDPGGRVSNRPAASLVSLFLPWRRFSEATDEHRLETLEMLLGAIPGSGWRLLVGAYPSSDGYVISRRPPSWRPWAEDGVPRPTAGECYRFIEEMERLLIENVGRDAARWKDFVGILSRLSPGARQRAMEVLSQHTSALKQHPDLNHLWMAIRKQLHRHNSYPDADWAMDPTELEALDAVYQALMPSDPAVAYGWVFDHWLEFPDGEVEDIAEAAERAAAERIIAIESAYESGGTPAILRVAEAAEEPFYVGLSVALCMDRGLALSIALECLGATFQKLRGLARGVFVGLFNQYGWKVLEEAIAKAKAGGFTPQPLADIYLATPALRETWLQLDKEDKEVQTAYWKSLWRPSIREWDSEDLALAVRQLLSVHRSRDAVEWLAYEAMSREVVIQLLDALPADAATDPVPPVEEYKIARLFETLDKSDDVSDDTIAGLEIPYLEILGYHRPELALHRQVIREPSLFADVISWAFKRSDGQAEEYVDDQLLQRRALVAFSVLWKLRLLPGLMEDGSVDVEALSTWVNEARRMCKERDRQDIGDEQIGQMLANAPAGKDGVWPCESVRDLLDDLASRHIGIGFTTGRINLRGKTSRGVYDGGEQERSLMDGYRQDAAKIGARWPFTAQLLHQLAANYEVEARREDQQADWSDQFES